MTPASLGPVIAIENRLDGRGNMAHTVKLDDHSIEVMIFRYGLTSSLVMAIGKGRMARYLGAPCVSCDCRQVPDRESWATQKRRSATSGIHEPADATVTENRTDDGHYTVNGRTGTAYNTYVGHES
jgi:hypothetical protein